MGLSKQISQKEEKIREQYIEQARQRGISQEDIEKLKKITEAMDKGIEPGVKYTFQDRLRVYGYYGVPLYEEYKIRKDIEMLEYLESRGITKITEQSNYIGVAQRKGGRLNRHIRYKNGEIQVEEESYKMMEEYKKGKTLEEIATKYDMSKANAGYRLEIMDPEYTYKYGGTSYNMLRSPEKVKEIEKAISETDVDDTIKRELKLPNVAMIKVVREGLSDDN